MKQTVCNIFFMLQILMPLLPPIFFSGFQKDKLVWDQIEKVNQCCKNLHNMCTDFTKTEKESGLKLKVLLRHLTTCSIILGIFKNLWRLIIFPCLQKKTPPYYTILSPWLVDVAVINVIQILTDLVEDRANCKICLTPVITWTNLKLRKDEDTGSTCGRSEPTLPYGNTF